MRLWHTKLISALPREQLVAQWRELSAIAGSIQKKGTPNHLLVNFILEYPYEDFISYAYHVRKEMTKRGYRTMNSVWEKICALPHDSDEIIPLKEVYKEKMDNTYLRICYWNLYEKMICDGILSKDWEKIEEVINESGITIY